MTGFVKLKIKIMYGLTKEEEKIYKEAKKNLAIDKDTMKELSKKYKVTGLGRYRYILTECKRPEYKGYPEADYNGTGLALTGVLVGNETLEDFIIFKECMKPVTEFRMAEMERKDRADWQREKRRK